ncbi:hypothetical protein ACFX5U_05665 [Sphingobacterium sp. SG20118]|uniref:DUF7674 family protein n=1 Tax=Sphingobacterium sp. SG20118 TaxID=3367156 RepID=UPI0037DFC5E9
MKTKMISTLEEWMPESRSWISDNDFSDHTISDYQILEKLADVCLKKMNSENEHENEDAGEIAKVVNLMYQGGNQYTRNAIENEFLTKLAIAESPASLKKHLDILPKELRKEYLKTILEN